MNFEAKVKYAKIDAISGKEKTVSETYLLDAETFGDAEEKTIKYMSEITSAQVISTVKKSNIEEAVGDKYSGTFYKSTIKLSIIDEFSGNESTETAKILAGGDDLKDALKRTEVWCQYHMSDTEITHIAKSPIVGIF